MRVLTYKGQVSEGGGTSKISARLGDLTSFNSSSKKGTLLTNLFFLISIYILLSICCLLLSWRIPHSSLLYHWLPTCSRRATQLIFPLLPEVGQSFLHRTLVILVFLVFSNSFRFRTKWKNKITTFLWKQLQFKPDITSTLYVHVIKPGMFSTNVVCVKTYSKTFASNKHENQTIV